MVVILRHVEGVVQHAGLRVRNAEIGLVGDGEVLLDLARLDLHAGDQDEGRGRAEGGGVVGVRDGEGRGHCVWGSGSGEFLHY